MHRAKPPIYRGHTTRREKFDAIVVMLGAVLLACAFGYLTATELIEGKAGLLRSGATHTWVTDRIRFIIAVGMHVGMTAFFALGGYALIRRLGWREWRH